MERLKELRKLRALTQKDMADFLKIDRTTYVKYENKQSEPTFDVLKRLADFFGVTVDYLLYSDIREGTGVQLSPDELALIELYRKLTSTSKKEVKNFALYELSKSEKTTASDSPLNANETA